MLCRTLSSLSSFSFTYLLAALIGTAGCSDVTEPVEPAADEPIEQGDVRTAPSISEDYPFPPVAADVAVYDRQGPDSFGHQSRYVFDEHGGFELQYVTDRWGLLSYTGTYSRSGSVITFDWDGWSIAGPWEATGRLAKGDKHLEVEYNIVMFLTDFENGTFEFNARISTYQL